jgi:hypothetical protein
MEPSEDEQETIEALLMEYLGRVSDALDADIYVVSGNLDRSSADLLISEYQQKALPRTNCALVLTTFGGDADGAFMIARFLKRAYQKFSLFVFGFCKSAGTLVALGADEIVMSEHGELGPLDVQMFQPDEIIRLNSGLDILQGLNMITAKTSQMFEENFSKLLMTGGTITTRTAADIATSMATQLLAPIAAQIDPLRLGEIQRAISIARQYGVRLGAKKETVEKLIYEYPSHGFVIDYEEARMLFPNRVREPKEDERSFLIILGRFLGEHLEQECIRMPAKKRVIQCLTEVASNEKDDTVSAEGANGDGENVRQPDTEASTETVEGSSGDNETTEQANKLAIRLPTIGDRRSSDGCNTADAA